MNNLSELPEKVHQFILAFKKSNSNGFQDQEKAKTFNEKSAQDTE